MGPTAKASVANQWPVPALVQIRGHATHSKGTDKIATIQINYCYVISDSIVVNYCYISVNYPQARLLLS